MFLVQGRSKVLSHSLFPAGPSGFPAQGCTIVELLDEAAGIDHRVRRHIGIIADNLVRDVYCNLQVSPGVPITSLEGLGWVGGSKRCLITFEGCFGVLRGESFHFLVSPFSIARDASQGVE